MKPNPAFRLLLPLLAFIWPGLYKSSAQNTQTSPALRQRASNELIESKFILADGQDELLRQQFNLKASKAAQEQVYFYDTKNLELNQHGLIIRVRMQADKKKGDTTIKVWPATYSEAGLNQNTKGYKCEIDVIGDERSSACSLTVKKANSMLEQALKNKSGVQSLLSPSQQQMAQQAHPFNWNELIAWGPNKALVWKKKVGELAFPFTVEQWTLTTGQIITEVSARSPQAQAPEVSNALKTYLIQHGLKLADKQESKTALTLRE